MEILKLLLYLAVIAFALFLLYWLVVLYYFLVGAWLYVLWVGLFAIVGVAGAALSWYQGYDNAAVLLLIAGLIGEWAWWGNWAMKNNPVLWAHKKISALHTSVGTGISDVLKKLRLRKPNARLECPKCGSRDIKLVNERTSTYESTGTFTRTVKHYAKDGTETGYSEEEYEAPAIEKVVYRAMRCVPCSHTWTNTS